LDENVAARREVQYIEQKHQNSVAAHARKVLPFSITNKLGLENYLSYEFIKFGENVSKNCAQ